MLNGMWKVWSRLENLAVTAMGRRQKLCNEREIMAFVEKEQVKCNLLEVEIDLTWCSRYTVDELKL